MLSQNMTWGKSVKFIKISQSAQVLMYNFQSQNVLIPLNHKLPTRTRTVFTSFPTLSAKVDLFLFSYFLASTNSTILLDATLQALTICIKSLLSALRCVYSSYDA